MYLLKHIDSCKGYVASFGYKRSYTHSLRWIRVFKTLEEAKRNRCTDSEYVVTLEEELCS